VAEIVLLSIGMSIALVLYNKSAKMRTPTNGTYTPRILSPSKCSWLKVLWGGGWTVKLLGSQRWWPNWL
jgi:hypothetical protein